VCVCVHVGHRVVFTSVQQHKLISPSLAMAVGVDYSFFVRQVHIMTIQTLLTFFDSHSPVLFCVEVSCKLSDVPQPIPGMYTS